MTRRAEGLLHVTEYLADALSGLPPKTPQKPPAVELVPGQGKTAEVAFQDGLAAFLGLLDMSCVDTTPGARCALAPPVGLGMTPTDYTALMRLRYRTSPAHRQHMRVFARRIGYSTITGPWAAEARRILEHIGP